MSIEFLRAIADFKVHAFEDKQDAFAYAKANNGVVLKRVHQMTPYVVVDAREALAYLAPRKTH